MELMIKIANLLFALCLGRHSLGFSQRGEDFIHAVDQGVAAGLKNVRSLGVKASADVVATFFGWLAIAYLAVFIVGNLVAPSKEWQPYVALATAICAIVWLSIKWFTRFQKYALTFFKDMLKLVSLILFLPVLDYVSGAESTSLIYSAIDHQLSITGVSLPEVDGEIAKALVMFLFYLAIFVGYWLISTVYFAAVAGIAVGIVASTVYGAGFIDKVWSKNQLTGLCVLLFIGTSVLTWL